MLRRTDFNMPSYNRPNRRRAANRKTAAQKQRNQLIILSVLLGIVLVALVLSMIVLGSSPVVKELKLEAGAPLTAQQFLKNQKKNAQFVTDISTIDLNLPGSHSVTLQVDGREYTCNLTIRDTVAPTAEPVETVIAGELPEASTLVTNIQDVSNVTATYKTAPNTTVAGDTFAEILLTDASGNTSVIRVNVTVKLDTVSPVIEVVPFVDHTVYLEDTIPYRSYVTYSDDKTPVDQLALSVDRSQVDIFTAGTYPVTYTVTDAAGNEASVTIQLTIKEKPTGYVEPDVAYGYAKQVLSQITTEGMSKAEIAAAIYNYVRHNISYSGSSDKNRGWAAGAVDGFTKHAGDCYTYYATAKALYDVAGIPNVDVVKVKTPQTSSSSHYWSLIDVGDGWYHVDCTPRAKNYTDSFFLYTDEEMLAYSRNNKNCFNFDLDAYPARETASVQSHIQFNSSTLKVTIKESW